MTIQSCRDMRRDTVNDFHMHTAFSGDSDAPVRACWTRLLRRGLDAVCITDHMDRDYPPDRR